MKFDTARAGLMLSRLMRVHGAQTFAAAGGEEIANMLVLLQILRETYFLM